MKRVMEVIAKPNWMNMLQVIYIVKSQFGNGSLEIATL